MTVTGFLQRIGRRLRLRRDLTGAPPPRPPRRGRLRAWLGSLGARPAPDLVGLALAAASVLLVVALGSWGMAAPFPDGHFASAAAIGIAAMNHWSWHTGYPTPAFLDHVPGVADRYMHHPPGVFWIAALAIKLFGAHDWVARLPAVLYAAATPFFIYHLGRALWSPLAGGIAALAYVSLPITLGYVAYHDLEQPVMFGCLVASWAYVRYVQTWRERYAWASVAAVVFALGHDWQGYIWVAPFLILVFARAFVLPERLVAPIRPRALGRYWALVAAAAVLTCAATVWLILESGRLGELLSSGLRRSVGGSVPLRLVLKTRAVRIGLMFTGLGVLMGKLALPVILARPWVKRSELELLAIPFFLMAVVQYVVFKQGADVHIFWPHTFAAYFALAAGALAVTAHESLGWLSRKLRPRAARVLAGLAPWAGLVLVGLPLLFVLKDGLATVRLGRETGGRYMEVQLETEVDKAYALRWFLKSRPDPRAGVGFHPGQPASWALQWEARPRPAYARQAVTAWTPRAPFYLMDTRAASADDLREAARRFHVLAVGHVWLIDRSEKPAPLDGFRLEDERVGPLARWLRGGSHPIVAVRPDPWVTWEWRAHLGSVAPAPAQVPATAEQIRIAHNIALQQGDRPQAAAHRLRLTRLFNLDVRAKFSNGTELIGAEQARGPDRALTLYFVAGENKGNAKFSVFAKVVKKPRFSTLPVDTAEHDIALPPAIPTSLWRSGHIYAIRVIYRKRPGTEVLTGAFKSLDARPAPALLDPGRAGAQGKRDRVPLLVL